ncbi:hypothetical protein LTR16_011297 [Cryomyces antarcticus]|uniref:Uncharacterized protein n=1 Tax=Cryomyces antarcticus TaxID=329879 RepID=A0ABR0M2Y5_9PEZI|nr:hypothetical protein LTR16_011297 [Cryomyces antarcticus]
MSQVPTKPMQSNHDSAKLPLGREATLRIKTMQAEDVSPTELSPGSGPGIPQDTRNKSLRKAVSGLEDLMQEALHVARDAVQQDRAEEATKILDEATLVLRKATTVRGLMLDPLPISDSEIAEKGPAHPWRLCLQGTLTQVIPL